MGTDETPTPKSEVLVEEYKLCERYATHMGSAVWQTAAVLFPVSFASLAYLFSRSRSLDIWDLTETMIVSAVGAAVLWIWFQFFKR